MAPRDRTLLILVTPYPFLFPYALLTITTVNNVSVRAGGSISIPCLYDTRYKNHVKYLCKGSYWLWCSYEVKTNQPSTPGRFSISDDKKQRIFTVTINDLMAEDTDYWCAVEIKPCSDDHLESIHPSQENIQPLTSLPPCSQVLIHSLLSPQTPLKVEGTCKMNPRGRCPLLYLTHTTQHEWLRELWHL
uniref:Immunoglobulin V-set domain-containing protein n=1 Tax=Myripristis murdjan TaxID=586833 RepID=A0A667ZIU0_9TELE